ncbi:hypothetical protein B296_00018134 [Ensete ventricosum]|uniref:ABC transporter domain-containing protein n=1 Tax=Ensete ventricosum TaxID=4639 RepID=A0A426ZQA9_ENSVE|nr:hypothetical protein B296_00018134 [Ensete ventricosum]
MSASSSNSASHEPVASSSDNRELEARGKNKNQDATKFTVPFYMLFSFGDSTDVILMVLGSLGALGNGLALPLMTLLFGDLIQSFGGASDIHDVLGRVSKVASFTGERRAVKKYEKYLVNAYSASVQESLVSGISLGTVMLFMFAGYSLGICSLGQIAPCMKAFAAGQAAAYKMFETINRKPEIDAYDANGKELDDIRGEIEFNDVYFSYPARPDEQIFSGFSLFIQQGTTLALVGESGSGKSTVISLIERFYDPQAGEVLIDGINIKEFQLRWIRGKIGLVTQEPVLFATSIRDNIAYGMDSASIEEIRAAAEIANAAKFIDKLPKLIRRIRLMTFQKVVNMEIEWFDDPENSSGAIGARLSADAATLAFMLEHGWLTAGRLLLAKYFGTYKSERILIHGPPSTWRDQHFDRYHPFRSGYDTLVGERGVQLSGGQKQRIAIARAMVKDPKIVLLDEATSALDAESERVVQNALDRVMVDRTTIVVAHRLSTIRGADAIAVVKNGVIVEKGKHETLISIKDGAYASLVALHLSSGS